VTYVATESFTWRDPSDGSLIEFERDVSHVCDDYPALRDPECAGRFRKKSPPTRKGYRARFATTKAPTVTTKSTAASGTTDGAPSW
jgi:hypothetical protein